MQKILLIVFLFLLATLAGVFFYSSSEQNKEISQAKNEILQANTQESPQQVDSVSETQIQNSVPAQSTEVSDRESTLLGGEDNFLTLNLPVSDAYGEPLRLGEESFTYTKIENFQGNKESLSSLSCEADLVTEYLRDRLGGWYYWNTCRDIMAEKGIRVNVLRLVGEEYIYERHYLDFVHGIYAVLELERGEGVTKDNISEKNSELKLNEYSSITAVDSLMKDIVSL